MRKGPAGYTDDVTKPGEEVYCRCYYIWVYAIRELPQEMLTQKGRRALVEVGMHLNATVAFARTDAADDDDALPALDAETGRRVEAAVRLMFR